MRPSACVTSTASSAGECFRTAAATTSSTRTEAIEEADQRHGDQAASSARAAEPDLPLATPPAATARPSSSPGNRACSQGVAPAGKSRSLIDNFVAFACNRRAMRRQVIRFRRARADADFGGRQSVELGHQRLGGFPLGEMRLAAVHAELLVAEVLVQRFPTASGGTPSAAVLR